MKIIAIAIIVLSLAIVLYLFGLAYLSRSGVAAGLIQGKLALCPDNPNCVCSETGNDSRHLIEPLLIPKQIALPESSAQDIMAVLKTVVVELGGVVQAEAGDYLAVNFTSAVFGFVDDLELRIDRQAGLVHIRSASRVGQSDIGVNRKRVQNLKELFSKKSRNSTRP